MVGRLHPSSEVWNIPENEGRKMARSEESKSANRAKARVIAMVAALGMVLAACGGSDDTSAAPAAPAVPAAPAEVCDGFPNRPIDIIVPYTAGGGTDQVGRLWAQIASLYSPVPIRHQTMPGAGAALGSRFVAEADKDGYTLSLGTSASIVSVGMLEDAGYDKDSFNAVAIITAPSFVFVTAPNSPFQTWSELLEYSKANPGLITYGVSGAGGSPGILVSGLQEILGFEWTLVPFDGSSAGVLAAAAGDVTLSVPSLGSALDVIAAGTVRPLIQTGTQRVPAIDGTPTFIDEGVDFSFTIWRTIAAPAGTPECVINILADIAEKVHANEEWVTLSTRIEGEPPIFFGPADSRAQYDGYASFLEPLVPSLRK